jgi:hypothetical protein
MAGWRQRLEQHTSCIMEELEEEDGIHTIEREACSRESHATVRMRTKIGSEAPRVQVPASDTNQSRTLQYGESVDGLENGTYRTRPRRQASQLKIPCKGIQCKLQMSKSLLAHQQQQWFDPRSAPFVTPPSTRKILEDEEELHTSRARTWAARMQGESNVWPLDSSNPHVMVTRL